MEIERRFVTSAELRVVNDGLRTKIIGHAIVFNELSEPIMGYFREQIAPEAVDRTLKEGIDLRAFIDHDPAKIMGRLSSKTLSVSKDQRGLRVEIDPPDTTYSRDTLESIRRGDLTGMSFAFRLMPDGFRLANGSDAELPTRTVFDMRISEVSVVTFPAYPTTDVDVAQRSLEEFRKESKILQQVHSHRYPPLSLRRRMLDIEAL